MPTTISKPIDERDMAATLQGLLHEIVKQNGVCTVLTEFSIEGLGTGAAKVLLSFDDAKCDAHPPAQ